MWSLKLQHIPQKKLWEYAFGQLTGENKWNITGGEATINF
jgi:hypothetical protein